MENRVYLQPAYILHKQPFQNSSLLLDFFCLDYGRVRAVARGARSGKSRYRSLLQVFQPLLVSLSGKGEVKTVTGVESSVAAIQLRGEKLFSGLYLNELITRLLLVNVEQAGLYQRYQEALVALSGVDELNQVLRRFEMALLDELGYAINLETDCVSRRPIAAESRYLFVPDLGFEELPGDDDRAGQLGNVFLGRHIQSLKALKFCDADSRQAAKRITRLALAAHLGDKPLHSRNLFLRSGRNQDPRL
ncbi:MAG: DNA repair protein RecO [Gammaproteobacteria bacterium]|nr:DNA repair protein RecO [Pseudomonadales bacterium]MCP5346438.1 DNA repair protein RecO [Pseudomonadales bacterium]